MTMVFKSVTFNKKAAILAVAVAAGLWLASPALAAEPGPGHAVVGGIAPLNEPDARRQDVSAGNPFDLIGTLNAIDGNTVTIGDRRLKMGPGARTSRVAPYQLVGARLNRVGEIVVLETISDEPH
jgi:hypothetical protein